MMKFLLYNFMAGHIVFSTSCHLPFGDNFTFHLKKTMKLTIWSALINEIWRREMMCFNSGHKSYGIILFLVYISNCLC